MSEAGGAANIWKAAASAAWSAIPIASVLAFLAASVKVFRAAGMETSTTVAIIGSANDVELLKGVLVSLLPGFITGVIALAIWEWSRHLPIGTVTSQSVFGVRALVMLVLLLVGAFTISVLAWLPIFALTMWLYIVVFVRWRTKSASESRQISYLRTSIVGLSLIASIGSVLLVALATNVWLPLREVSVTSGQSIQVGSLVFQQHVAAYVLNSDDKTTTLLLDNPRAVVTVATTSIEPNPPICVPVRRGSVTVLQRPTQLIGLDPAFDTPYEQCPPSQ